MNKLRLIVVSSVLLLILALPAHGTVITFSEGLAPVGAHTLNHQYWNDFGVRFDPDPVSSNHWSLWFQNSLYPVPDGYVASVSASRNDISFLAPVDFVELDLAVQASRVDEPGEFIQLNLLAFDTNSNVVVDEVITTFDQFLTVRADAAGLISGLVILRDAKIAVDTLRFGPDIAPPDGVTPITEPATLLLFGSGLIGLVAFRRKFRK